MGVVVVFVEAVLWLLEGEITVTLFDLLQVLHPVTQLPLLLMCIVRVLASAVVGHFIFFIFYFYMSVVVCSSGACWMDFDSFHVQTRAVGEAVVTVLGGVFIFH